MKTSFKVLLPLLVLLTQPAAVQAQYNYTTNSGTITITAYTGPGGAVTMPTTINGLLVTSIGEYAFSGNSSLTSVTIGASAILEDIRDMDDGKFAALGRDEAIRRLKELRDLFKDTLALGGQEDSLPPPPSGEGQG